MRGKTALLLLGAVFAMGSLGACFGDSKDPNEPTYEVPNLRKPAAKMAPAMKLAPAARRAAIIRR